MKRLDPRFIESFSMQATRLMKAIRCVQTLEDHLPEDFPQPEHIAMCKRPYDLEMFWASKDKVHGIKLSAELSRLLDFDEKWHKYAPDSMECRAKVCVGGKSTMNLIMRIAGPLDQVCNGSQALGGESRPFWSGPHLPSTD